MYMYHKHKYTNEMISIYFWCTNYIYKDSQIVSVSFTWVSIPATVLQTQTHAASYKQHKYGISELDNKHF